MNIVSITIINKTLPYGLKYLDNISKMDAMCYIGKGLIIYDINKIILREPTQIDTELRYPMRNNCIKNPNNTI